MLENRLDPSSLKIKRSMQHHNLGMGTPARSEKIANILQMVYKKGGAVAKEDATNAFNTLKRQDIRIQQDKVLPEATKSLNFFYGG
jgi:TFIIF-interacting CTD phosphatase-like protein